MLGQKRPLLIRHLLGGCGLAILVDRNYHRPLLVLENIEAVLLRRLLHRFHLIIQFVLRGLAFRLHLRLKRLPAERRSQCLGQTAHKALHRISQFSAFACRQPDGDWFAGRTEIVQIDPIVWRLAVA